MSRKKLLLNLFISKNPKFSSFYKNFDDSETYTIENTYIFNDKPVNHKKFLFGVVSVPDDKLNDLFFITSVKYEAIFVFDKIDLANFLEELGFDIFDEDYENEYDKDAKDDILRTNIKKSLKIIENTLNNFSKENSLVTSLKRDLHPKSIPFSELSQSDLYNKTKRG